MGLGEYNAPLIISERDHTFKASLDHAARPRRQKPKRWCEREAPMIDSDSSDLLSLTL